MNLLQPLRRKATASSKAVGTSSLQAPTGGWNAKDPLANMRPDQAILLDNWFPRTTDVILREGASDHVTGFNSPVRSLMPFNGYASQALFACTDGGIFDATSAGVVGAAVAACNNGVFSYTNFNTLGGNYLIAVNGVDDMKRYDGAAWSDVNALSVPAITGVATAEINAITVFKRRIWMLQKDTMSAWYLGTDQIAGAAVEFPVGQLCKLGGSLAAIGSWTIDGGDGADDHLVLVTTRGEILVYRGTDPASATTFALVGVYFIGVPIGGQRALAKYGGDLLLMVESGLYPLSRALQSATVTRQVALSSNIQQPISDAATVYADFSGWQVSVLPQVNALQINVPTIEQTTSVQFVMNSITGAWCRFTGWNAMCFETFQDNIYYGGTDKVALCWSGQNDFGANIVGDARQAFNYFGARGQQKHIKLIRPILLVTGPYTYSINIDADFEDLNSYATLPSVSSVYAVWDTSLWDTGVWAPDLEVKREWQTVFSRPGFALSARLRVAANSASVSWVSTDYVIEKGGIL